MPGCLYFSEGVDVLRHELLSICGGVTRGNEVGVSQRDERRLQFAPTEIDHERPDLHELADDLREAGDLRNEVVLVESMRTRFGVDLSVGLRPSARPIAGEAAAGNLVGAALVHRTLHGTLEATIHAGAGAGARFHVDAWPVIVRRCTGDRLDQPEVVVVN